MAQRRHCLWQYQLPSLYAEKAQLVSAWQEDKKKYESSGSACQ